jgi:ElaB/YqjD/DUF883 family membrane-anchored ribosome-binding protein
MPPIGGRRSNGWSIPMADQTASKIGAAAQRASENGRELYERAKDQAQSAIEAGREGLDAVAEEGKRQVESVSGVIRDWPLLSVGVAFLAGCLVSRLMHGGR